MDEAQKEKFRKQLESYKKDLGLEDKIKRKSTNSQSAIKKISEKNVAKIKESFNLDKEISEIKDKKVEKVVSDLSKEIKNETIKKDLNSVADLPKKEPVKINKPEEKKVVPPTKKVDIPEKKIETPVKKTETPVKKTETPVKKTETPVKKIETPLKKVDTEVKRIDQKSKDVKVEVKKEIKKPVENIKKNEPTKETKLQAEPDLKTQNNTNKTVSGKNELSAREIAKAKQLGRDKEDKKSKLPFLLVPILLLVIGGLAYYFNSNSVVDSNENKQDEEEISSEAIDRENFVNDSIIAFENAQIESSEPAIKLLSDSVYNIQTNNDEGYYVVIGAYGALKNAKKLQNNNPTIFDAIIFEGDVKRVALSVGNEDSEAIENLEIIRFKYPDAWIMYNTNEY